jgi:hypothetical protein
VGITVLGLLLLLPVLGIVETTWASVINYGIMLSLLLLWFRQKTITHVAH